MLLEIFDLVNYNFFTLHLYFIKRKETKVKIV